MSDPSDFEFNGLKLQRQLVISVISMIADATGSTGLTAISYTSSMDVAYQTEHHAEYPLGQGWHCQDLFQET